MMFPRRCVTQLTGKGQSFGAIGGRTIPPPNDCCSTEFHTEELVEVNLVLPNLTAFLAKMMPKMPEGEAARFSSGLCLYELTPCP